MIEDLPRLIALIREEFEKAIAKEVNNQVDIMAMFDRACLFGMSKYAREKGIVID